VVESPSHHRTLALVQPQPSHTPLRASLLLKVAHHLLAYFHWLTPNVLFHY